MFDDLRERTPQRKTKRMPVDRTLDCQSFYWKCAKKRVVREEDCKSLGGKGGEGGGCSGKEEKEGGLLIHNLNVLREDMLKKKENL